MVNYDTIMKKILQNNFLIPDLFYHGHFKLIILANFYENNKKKYRRDVGRVTPAGLIK